VVYLRPVEFDIRRGETIVSMVMDHFSMQGSVEHHLCAVVCMCIQVETGGERKAEGERERGKEERGLSLMLIIVICTGVCV